MSMVGDGPSDQPTEGVDALSELAAALEPGEQDDTPDPDEPASEGEEESEEVETEEDESEEEEGAEEPTFTIKVDGKEVNLKQSELIEQAQKGFDYTQKTMALAEERKAIEPIKQQAENYRQQQEQAWTQAAAQLDAYAKYVESQVGTPPPITLAQQDAASYLAQKELYEARKGQLSQVLAESARVKEEQARQRQAWINQKAQASEKVLKDTLPGWNDAMLDGLATYASGLGLTMQNADMVMLEPGFWELAHKAKAYDEMVAKRAAAKPKTPITQVAKPGAANPTSKAAAHAKRMAEFDKNPSVDALARILG